MLASILGMRWHGKMNLFTSGLIIGAICTILFIIIDKYNLLVEYELWLRRGLPDAWELK